MNEGATAARLVREHTGLSLVRAINEQRVLEALLREGPMSRAQVARLTGLSKPTVSSVIKDLVACGLVRERGQQSGNVGRPSTLYEAVPDGGYVFGADVGGAKIRAGIADPYGEVVVEATEPTAKETAQTLVEQIGRLFGELANRAKLQPGRVWTAGIGIPGVYDPGDDRVSWAPNLPDLSGLAISEALAQTLGIPVVVDNDVNLAAAGERWRGLAQDRDHFVAISIGTGIGMGIVLNGELYRGSRGAAGEIDYLPLGDDPFDGDRGHGPLESASAAPAILERLRHKIDAGGTTQASPEDVAGIFEAAERGEPVAVELVEQEARIVATAIAAVAAVLDPELVILGGGLGSNPALLKPVRRYVAELFPRPLEVQISAMGNAAAFYGALAVALQAAREELLARMAGAR